MFILWRYILKEHVGPFLFAMSIITLVFLMNLVFRELGRILSKGLEFSLILEFFFLNMAWIIALAVPMAVLVATLMAFGRLSGDSEIIAMKAGGISIIHMIMPVVITSIGLALSLIWFNNHILPEFNHRTRLLANDIARKRPTLNLEAGVVMKDIPNINILVQSLEETQDTAYVKSIWIEDNRKKEKSKYIFSKSGKIFANPATAHLVMELYDGEMHELDLKTMEKYTRLTFPQQRLTIEIPGMSLERSSSEHRGDREKSAKMMMEEVRQNHEMIKERYNRVDNLITNYFEKHVPLELDGATNPMAPPIPNNPLIRHKVMPLSPEGRLNKIKQDNINLKRQITAEMNIVNNLERSNYKLMVEVHKKYSIPFACIVFVLVGAPLGIMARKGNMAVAGGISFTFFLIYWVSLIGGEELADNKLISPFMAMWLANIIVGAGGVYLVVHSIHEATFINWTAIPALFKRLFKSKKRKTQQA